jgi:tRNA A37 threonylcarbamoyladenosine synthetase subunit TsaC/SUA5/YrdC
LSQFFTIHPTHPEPRLLKQAAAIVTAGGLVVCLQPDLPAR